MRPIVTFAIMYTIKVNRWFRQLSLLLPVIFSCGPWASPHQRLWPFAIKSLDAHALTHAKHTELSVLSQKPATWAHHSHLPWDIAYFSSIKKLHIHALYYRNRRFIAVCTWAIHLSYSPSDSPHLDNYFFEINFNITLPSTSCSSKQSVLLKLSE